jgi:sulfatase maturation enzyme AslB (radical SAM superfamily)
VLRETFALDDHREAYFAEEIRYPKNVTVFPTNICNARCTFCLYPQHTDPKLVMEMEVYRRAIDDLILNGVTQLLLSPNNGDPLADPKIVEKMEYARSKGMKHIQFNTNGILLSRGDLTEHLVRLMDEISISLPGFDRENYRTVYGVDKAEQVLAGVVKLAESKVSCDSKIVINLEFRVDRPFEDVLCDEGMRLIKPFIDDGVMVIHQIRCDDMFDWSGLLKDEDLTGIMKIRPVVFPEKRLPCNRILTDFNLTVLADGAVRVCNCGRGASNYGELIIGRITESPTADMVLNQQHRRLLTNWMKGTLPDECQGCAIWQPNPIPWKTLVRLFARLLRSAGFWKRRLGIDAMAVDSGGIAG